MICDDFGVFVISLTITSTLLFLILKHELILFLKQMNATIKTIVKKAIEQHTIMRILFVVDRDGDDYDEDVVEDGDEKHF